LYQDFDDLRDNFPAEIKTTTAIDIENHDPERLIKIWPATEDCEYRLDLTSAISDFWEAELHERGGDNAPYDCFAIEMTIAFLSAKAGATQDLRFDHDRVN